LQAILAKVAESPVKKAIQATAKPSPKQLPLTHYRYAGKIASNREKWLVIVNFSPKIGGYFFPVVYRMIKVLWGLADSGQVTETTGKDGCHRVHKRTSSRTYPDFPGKSAPSDGSYFLTDPYNNSWAAFFPVRDVTGNVIKYNPSALEANSMECWHYRNFELKLTQEGDRYHAHVYRSPAGEAVGEFSQPLSSLGIENLVLRLTRLRSASRAIDSPEVAAARKLGGKLFDAVFRGQVRDCLRASLEIVRAHPKTGLRLKLRLQDTPDLANLPWEFLYDTGLRRFLAQSKHTPVVRYVEMPESITPLKAALPLRILGLISSPSDYRPLDTQREKALLQKALAPLLQTRQVEVDWLPTATLNGLRVALRQEAYHIFHFIGHGGFDNRTAQGMLALENKNGRGKWVSGETLGVLLHDHRSMRLAVLNACEGARNTSQDPFAGVATTLVQQGLPAVVAMQFEISDTSAIAFAQEFYAVLAQGWPVDTAVAEARRAIYCLNAVEWGTPVLYLRAENGVLFDLTTPAGDAAQPPVLPTPDVPETPMPEPLPQPRPMPETFPLTSLPALLHTLRGHDKQVNSVALSPDGHCLASGSGGFFMGTSPLRLWDAVAGKQVETLEEHTDSVRSVTFSPDGSLLASGAEDKTVRLWDVATRGLLRTLEGHTDWVNSVAFSSDGSLLASGADDNMVRLWDVAARKLLDTLEEHTNWVNSVAFSSDGSLLASGSHDKTIQVYRLR
jgi:hypothetical protein